MRKFAAAAVIVLAICTFGLCSICVLSCRAETVSSVEICDEVVAFVPSKEIPACRYTAIRIVYGDTLEGIENRYNTSGTFTSCEYISELKRINDLHGDTIHAGNYLTVIMN